MPTKTRTRIKLTRRPTRRRPTTTKTTKNQPLLLPLPRKTTRRTTRKRKKKRRLPHVARTANYSIAVTVKPTATAKPTIVRSVCAVSSVQSCVVAHVTRSSARNAESTASARTECVPVGFVRTDQREVANVVDSRGTANHAKNIRIVLATFASTTCARRTNDRLRSVQGVRSEVDLFWFRKIYEGNII